MGPEWRLWVHALLVGAFWVAGVLAPTPLYAQQDVAVEAQAEPDRDVRRNAPAVDEITVTGTQNDVTNVQDEAQAITSFGMEDLDRANIINVDQLAFNVPGLHVGRQGNRVIVTLRGIGTENAAPTGEPGVAYVVDGVNYARPQSAQIAFFDLEGVNVMRGPQGLQGGKNTTAGWISVQTRKPHGDFEASGDIQVGAYDQLRYRTALNLPLSEYLQLRSAVFFEDRDGYLNNIGFPGTDRDPFDADDLGLRQHIRLLPTESLDLLLSYNYFRQKGNGTQAKLLPLELQTQCAQSPLEKLSRLPSAVACFPATVFPVVGLPADESTLLSQSSIHTDAPAARSNRFWGLTQTTTWDAPEMPLVGATQLKGIFSFQDMSTSQSRDFDTVNVPKNNDLLQSETASQHSGELQWTGGLGERFEWQLSAWFLRETTRYDLNLSNLASQDAVDDPIRGWQETEAKSYAGAFHGDFHWTETLTVGFGARYTKDTRRVTQVAPFRGGLASVDLTTCVGGVTDTLNDLDPDLGLDFENSDFTTSPPTLVELDLPVPTCKRTFRALTGGLRLEWRPQDEHLVYARADRGYKSGGFASMSFGTYEPEYIWAYALGSKSSFFEDRMTLNFEAFLSDYNDLQLVVIDSFAARTDTANARIAGFDLEFEAEPVAGLRFDGKLSYLNAALTDYLAIDPINRGETKVRDICQVDPTHPDCPPSFTQYKGNLLSRSPRWTYSVGAEYELYTRWGSLTPRVQYYWQDETFYSGFNRDNESTEISRVGGISDLQEAYHFTNLKLTWRSPDERYTVEAFVDNLEDDRVFQNLVVGPAPLGSPLIAYYGRPRVWGLRVGFQY